MVTNTNPAGRLYNVLLQAVQASNKNKSVGIRRKQDVIWAEVFDIKSPPLTERDTSTVGIYYHLALLRQLLDESERKIKTVPDISHDVYLRDFLRIREALSPANLNGDWSEHLINHSSLTSLEFCSELLSRLRPEQIPSDEQLRELRDDVSSLMERILTENLDPELKLVLLDLLESMNRAISEYRFRGGQGLRQELFLILGRLQEHFSAFHQHSKNPVVESFWGIITRYDALTSFCLNVPQVLSGVTRFFLQG